MEKTDRDNVYWRDRKHFMWFPFSFTVYEVRNDRLYIQRGLFNTTYDETLLYRIVDLSMRQSLGQKIFGTGTVQLVTRVDQDRDILLLNIKNPKKVKELLSELVEDARKKKSVVGKEFYGHQESPAEDDDDFIDEENL